MSNGALLEISSIQELFAEGADDHYVVGNTFKYTYYSLQHVPGMEGLQRVAILKIARPVSSLRNAIEKIGAATSQPPCVEGRRVRAH